MWWPWALSGIQDRRQSHSLSHHAKEASFLISAAGRLLSLRQSWARCPSSPVFIAGLDLTGALLSVQISAPCLDECWIPTRQGQWQQSRARQTPPRLAGAGGAAVPFAEAKSPSLSGLEVLCWWAVVEKCCSVRWDQHPGAGRRFSKAWRQAVFRNRSEWALPSRKEALVKRWFKIESSVMSHSHVFLTRLVLVLTGKWPKFSHSSVLLIQ